MANIDQTEAGISEPSKDGPETTNALTRGETTLPNPAQSPVTNSEQLHPVKSPISLHSTTPDVPAPPLHPSPASSVSATHTPFSIPHPKKFSAVTINKTFLQKNSTSSATASATSGHVTAVKAGSPAPRPAPQPSGSHSKLVTAKLTSTAQLSATTAPGWSRPSSATPPVSATPSGSSNVPPQTFATAPAAPHLPHVGKVIQPQPRRAIVSSSSLVKKDSSSVKPAWGNAKPLSANAFTDNALNDFPTAAEVAQGRIVKAEAPKAEDTLAPKQVAPQEADAFRGVHLDPNAHHWDEMEEDDDNFLDNVIEFGDGRQYKVAPTGTVQPPASATLRVDGNETSPVAIDNVVIESVSKEDRFADDFDRSWPRSRLSPIVLQRDVSSRSSRQASISPASSQPSHSPMEGSRVLFNERSNRLEPYTNTHFPIRYGSGSGLSRRNAHAEPHHSSAESRFSRDAPHSPAYSVQLLQKPVEGSRDASIQPPRSHAGDFIGRRQPERDGGPPPFGSHYGQHWIRGRDASGPPGPPFGDSRGPSEGRPRRFSGTSFASGPIPDGLRQGPPHVPYASFPRKPQSRESPSQSLSVIPGEVSTTTVKLGHSPDVLDSTASEVHPLTAASVMDIEGVHKTAMHVSAERAKQRRQLEEEEREKEKERAHKKAAELEERMKHAEAAKKQAQDTTAIEIIQEAVNSAQGSIQLASNPDAIEIPSSLQPVARPHRDFRASRSISISSNELTPPADQVNSWRSKTRPLTQGPQPISQPPPPMFVGTEEPISVVADEILEVVDFSELGKFVGVEQSPPLPSHSPLLHDRPSLPARPVASDFFEDVPPHRNSVGVWEAEFVGSPSTERSNLPAAPEFSAATSVRNHVPPTGPQHRSSKQPAPFREVPMSALDDVMSRIKGALDNMQVDAGKEASSNDSADWRLNVAKLKVRPDPPSSARILPKEARWLPPALRPRRPPQDPDQEVFDVTGCEPPRSPRPDSLVVKLPVTCREIKAIPERQLRFLKNGPSHVRFDILSWDPPLGVMNKRDLSVNDILFKRPPLTKGKLRCKVHLPRTTYPYSVSAPKVNLPSISLKINTTSGRSKAVDDLLTWRRRPTPPSVSQQAALPEEILLALDVTSCSPSPELSGASSKPTIGGDPSAKMEIPLVRPRTQPKLPAGSAIGFYRDLGSSCPDLKTTVNFTVTSELEELTHVSQLEPTMLLLTSTAGASPVRAPSELKETAFGSCAVDEVSESPSVPSSTQVDGRSSEGSTERSLRTPASASFSTPWSKSPLGFPSKDSPARAPDPEHLKAVWSQATDKEPMAAVNSLEGIADDLTALPFTIQEVKSEDGETPPPTTSSTIIQYFVASPSSAVTLDCERSNHAPFQLQLPPAPSSPWCTHAATLCCFSVFPLSESNHDVSSNRA
ncbi:hypothetical protein PAXRUDRAFT_24167 [Paxillus rubicundulus Ve08.2h10]|uniref:Uncharacterized protein n=1 Tax=Paxillus rubicundulus Ve08.2h10 TaxID=930991 RepID=A0A0D0DV62_9AGAM|nr:hypothetical protein PAXRUDRAFT_24167 [Paxillus rubicundulus Ve08.2h10]